MINFSFHSVSSIVFAAESLKMLSTYLQPFGKNVLLIHGASSLQRTKRLSTLLEVLASENYSVHTFIVPHEPTPELIDECVDVMRSLDIEVVVAIGGGSVLDAGKAVSAMLKLEDSVQNYLEGVGNKTHPGIKIPFIAVPTTSGTGSEMTKNAVITKIGKTGFKKSLRHNNFIPDMAIIDPSLTLYSPESLTFACAMDAFSQLLESFVSNKASLLTDALAKEGIAHIGKGLEAALNDPGDIQAREHLAYASMLSGMTLANAGLGVVHGIASPMGAHYPVPHGIVCATLIYEANKMTIECLQHTEPAHLALKKFDQASCALGLIDHPDAKEGRDELLRWLKSMKERFKLPSLQTYGVEKEGISLIARKSSNKENPIAFTTEQIEQLIFNTL